MNVTGSTILVASGKYVDPLDLKAHDVCIEDVAHALSNQCRFSGHVSRFYSVAEHCVRVHDLLCENDEWAEVALWGLLHDAAEAYLVDLPRPLKRDPAFGPGYRQAEHRAMRAIIERFDLLTDEPEAVREADLVLLATERRDLLPGFGDWAVIRGIEPLELKIHPWPPGMSGDAFLKRFGGLMEERALRDATDVLHGALAPPKSDFSGGSGKADQT